MFLGLAFQLKKPCSTGLYFSSISYIFFKASLSTHFPCVYCLYVLCYNYPYESKTFFILHYGRVSIRVCSFPLSPSKRLCRFCDIWHCEREFSFCPERPAARKLFYNSHQPQWLADDNNDS